MGSIRKMKREQQPKVKYPNIEPLIRAAYDRGYNKGADEQRTLDIQSITNLLNDLESLPGIGKATANKVRVLVASKLGE
jgi:endonuclease III